MAEGVMLINQIMSKARTPEIIRYRDEMEVEPLLCNGVPEVDTIVERTLANYKEMWQGTYMVIAGVDDLIVSIVLHLGAATKRQVIDIVEAIAKANPELPLSHDRENLSGLVQNRLKNLWFNGMIRKFRITDGNVGESFYEVCSRGIDFVETYDYRMVARTLFFGLAKQEKVQGVLVNSYIASKLAADTTLRGFSYETKFSCRFKDYMQHFGSEDTRMDVVMDCLAPDKHLVKVGIITYPDKQKSAYEMSNRERYREYVKYSIINFAGYQSKMAGNDFRIVIVCKDMLGMQQITSELHQFGKGSWFAQHKDRVFICTEATVRAAESLNVKGTAGIFRVNFAFNEQTGTYRPTLSIMPSPDITQVGPM